jgi:integrase
MGSSIGGRPCSRPRTGSERASAHAAPWPDAEHSTVDRCRPRKAQIGNIVQTVLVRRRARAAGVATRIGNHTFRATGITAYLKNGGTLEKAAMIANHASTRTTQLYDRRNDEVSLDEVERILI